MAHDEAAADTSGGLAASHGANDPASRRRRAGRAAMAVAVLGSVAAAGACLLPWEVSDVPALKGAGRVDLGAFAGAGVLGCIGAGLALLATAQLVWRGGAAAERVGGGRGSALLGALAAMARIARRPWAGELGWTVGGALLAAGAGLFTAGHGHRPGSVGPTGLGVVQLQPWLVVAGGAGLLTSLAGLAGLALRLTAARGGRAAPAAGGGEPPTRPSPTDEGPPGPPLGQPLP